MTYYHYSSTYLYQRVSRFCRGFVVLGCALVVWAIVTAAGLAVWSAFTSLLAVLV